MSATSRLDGISGATAVARVTIVIPVFNGADFLSAAIDSALAQTWPDIEVLVVNDGSNDGGATADVIASYGERIRAIHKPNGGVATALNVGIQSMRSDWFSWLSHDDLYHPRKVEAQMRALRGHEPDAFAFGDYSLIDESNNLLGEVDPTSGYESSSPLWAIFEGRLNGCTILAPRSILEEAGGFHTGLPTTQDYHLWFRLARRHNLVAVPGAFVSHRVHPKQGSRHARHAEEAGLLWMEMLDELTPEEITRHAPSRPAFLRRASRFLDKTGYGVGRSAMTRLLNDERREWPLMLLWTAEGAPGPAQFSALLQDSGFRNVTCVVADISADAVGSLALHGHVADSATILRLEGSYSLLRVLEATQAIGFKGIILLADAATTVDMQELRDRIDTVAAGEADAYLSMEASLDVVSQPLPAAFRGAVVSSEIVGKVISRCRALGSNDAIGAFGLVARIAHQPVSRAPSVSVRAVNSPPTISEPPKSPGPPSALAASRFGRRVLAIADGLHRRNPALRRWIGPLVGFAFGIRGVVGRSEYLEANPDVRDGGSDPVIHYLRFGWLERRDPRPASLSNSVELEQRGRRIATHSVGRRVVKIASGLHDRFPFLRGHLGPLLGRILGLSRMVDRAAYVAANPDVRAAGADPLLHYLSHGLRERRQPRPALPVPNSRPVEFWLPQPLSQALPSASPNGAARLLITHGVSGGTQQYGELVAAQLRRRGERVIFAWGIGNRHLHVSATGSSKADITLDLPEGMVAAIAWLKSQRVARVDVLHTIGLERHIEAILKALAVPYDVTFVDYHLIAVNPHLLGADGYSLLGRGTEDAVRQLLRPEPMPIVWNASRRLACSRDLAARLERLVPGIGAMAVYPPEPEKPGSFRVRPPRADVQKRAMRVLSIGALVRHKGRETILAVAARSAQRAAPLEFHVAGFAEPEVQFDAQIASRLKLYGRYSRESLGTLVAAIDPDLVWLPAEAAETFGFTLSESMGLGLPILTRGLGAYPERLEGREFTWVVPTDVDATPDYWIDTMLSLKNAGLRSPAATPSVDHLAPVHESFYETEY